MAGTVNFNMSESVLGSQGIVIFLYGESGDTTADASFYFICNGQTYSIVHSTTLSGLQEIFPKLNVKHYDWEGIRPMLEAVTKANCTP